VAKEVETYKKAGYDAVSRRVRITAESIRRDRGRLPDRPGGLFRRGHRVDGRAPARGGEVAGTALEVVELIGPPPG
jgi:hypothetical protein